MSNTDVISEPADMSKRKPQVINHLAVTNNKLINLTVSSSGHDEPKIDSLATAISLPPRPSACTKLMGSADWTTTFAQKLAVKTKHQVFIMADELEPDEVPLSEKVVFQKLRTDPHIFLTEPEVPS